MSNIKKYMLTMILMIIALVVFIPTQVNARTLSIGDNLKLIGKYCLVQKPKEMTLEDIEEALGYPVKIVKEK